MKNRLFLLLACTIFVGTFIGGDSKQLGLKSKHGPSSKHIGSRAKHGSKSKHGQSREGDDDSQVKYETTGDRTCGRNLPLRTIMDPGALRVDPDSGHPYTSGVFVFAEDLPDDIVVDVYYMMCNEDFSDCNGQYDRQLIDDFCARLENPTSNLKYPWESLLNVTEGIGLPTTCSNIKIGNYLITDQTLYSQKMVEFFQTTGHEYYLGKMYWYAGDELIFCQELPVHIYKA